LVSAYGCFPTHNDSPKVIKPGRVIKPGKSRLVKQSFICFDSYFESSHVGSHCSADLSRCKEERAERTASSTDKTYSECEDEPTRTKRWQALKAEAEAEREAARIRWAKGYPEPRFPVEEAEPLPDLPSGPHPSHIGRYKGETPSRHKPPYPKPPIPAPPYKTGQRCTTESKAYAKALEAHRKSAYLDALEKLGAVEVPTVQTFFHTANELRNFPRESNRRGVRHVMVDLPVARIGNTLHLVNDYASTTRVPVVACGSGPCGGSSSGAVPRPFVSTVVVEPDQKFGKTIVLHYDSWWVSTSYAVRCRVPPDPPP
jgi:hypothetical protein